MESLSRPFHSRKLSNASSFSPKNAYDGVFSGHRHNYAGASPIELQDYREIFGSSPAATSIPVLDLSTLREPSDSLNLNLNLNFRSSNSNPDYSKIFGRFRDEDVAVSYEELFARDKSRAPSSQTSSSPDSDNSSRQSSDALKQFNMSYNKRDGTRHVAQLHTVPRFTRFIDEAIPPLMEAKKHESSSKHHPVESFYEDKTFKTFDNRKDYTKRSTAINSDSSEGTFDDEVDVNSTASASAEALKKAIEKAQESIRIAKESIGRKKKGLRSFSSKSLKVEGRNRMKDENTGEEQKDKNEVKRVFERVISSSQLSSDMGRNGKYFMDSEKLFVAKKFLDEINGKISESTKECSILKNTIVSNSIQVTEETVKIEEDEKKVSQEFVLSNNEKQEDVEQECIESVEKSDDEASLKESVQICDNKLQESEESGDRKVENLEFDHDVKVDMNGNNVETTREDSCELEVEETEEMKGTDESEGKLFEKVSGDETSSDDNEYEYEVKFNDTDVSEENDIQSESSSKEEEESNIQLPHIEKVEIETTNETEKENKEKVDEVAAREREREKDRLAVDRAIREARERARERAERAAVEKATEEIRQRMRADAREKASVEAREKAERAAVEKATEEIRERMRADAREKAAKASAQSKLRAERAAVERATSEARQRALEKAMSQKKSGTTSEAALRNKAKLEKDNKIMERAAKALAEKEKRDLLAQKEQAERNRLAENLDADIKKWSNGKEGNLRALLSTLQFILGPESGWQPISLTEIIARSAVKKAYRKATLCVHPDKLQQRGASIQHKYICEKVFDLLKAAWNKFNPEER